MLAVLCRIHFTISSLSPSPSRNVSTETPKRDQLLLTSSPIHSHSTTRHPKPSLHIRSTTRNPLPQFPGKNAITICRPKHSLTTHFVCVRCLVNIAQMYLYRAYNALISHINNNLLPLCMNFDCDMILWRTVEPVIQGFGDPQSCG